MCLATNCREVTHICAQLYHLFASENYVFSFEIALIYYS